MGYPNEISKSLNADHHTVCKFDNNESSDYISVRNALKTLITDVCATGTWTVARRLALGQSFIGAMFDLYLVY